MEITILHVDDCPNVTLARGRLDDALARVGVPARVEERVIATAADAAADGFAGSPTILIDGLDPFPTALRTSGLACRLYPSPAGPQGAPTVEELVAVLQA